MGFNPLEEKGIPIEKQIRNWEELNVKPYNKDEVDPYTRTRVILMNGIEVEGVINSHEFARHTEDLRLKHQLALTRRAEQQQQKAVNWLIPANESVLEATIAYEQLAVDLTANLAKMEPDPYVRQTFEFGLLEDFDHLYRYANLMELTMGKKAEQITRHLTEITPGRPTVVEHRYPFDDVRRFSDCHTGSCQTQLHALTLTAAEQQTMNFYMNQGNRQENFTGRGLYLEIGMIEEQHVTQYESLLDPNMSWFEMLVMHEYNECYVYYSMWSQEVDPRIKKLWDLHLNMEIEHLRIAAELLKQYENKDAREILPKELPELIKLESNIDYVRDVLKNQVDLISLETDYIPINKLPKDARYYTYQKQVNGNGFIPSNRVIEETIGKFREDYRDEVKGPNPVERLRSREKVTV